MTTSYGTKVLQRTVFFVSFVVLSPDVDETEGLENDYVDKVS